jgi:integrase
MLDRGASPRTVREVMVRLSGVPEIAAEHGHIASNPVRTLHKPRLEAGEEVDPLSAVKLERLVAGLEGRDRAIVLLGAHLGLRPLEIRAVEWSALTEDKLMIGRARTEATARRFRVIDVPQVTGRELREWRLRSGRPVDSDPIIGAMTANALKLWGTTRLRPAIRGCPGSRGSSVTAVRV